MLLNETIYSEIYKLRPKLGRSCRCICMLGHGYESVVESVLFLARDYCYLKVFIVLSFSNIPVKLPITYNST